MGHITIAIVRENQIRKFVFIHGAFIDDKWSARLVDDSNCIINIFEAECYLQCIKEFTKFLRGYGAVIDMNGEDGEDATIDLLYENLHYS